MNLKTLQKELLPWRKRNFGGQVESWQPLLGVVEEVGEICHAYLKRKQGIRGSKVEHNAAIEDGVADLVIFLADFCNHERIDLAAILRGTWRKVKKRNWKKDKKGGGV